MPTMHEPSALPAPVPELGTTLLRRILKAQWNIGAYAIDLLCESEGLYVYEVREETDYLLKVYPPSTDTARLRNDAAIMEYLHAALFPAPRVLHSREGHFFCSARSRKLLLQSRLPGTLPARSLLSMARLGTLTARLHCLPPPGIQAPLRSQDLKAEMLATIRPASAPEACKEMLKALPSFARLPETLIHTRPDLRHMVLLPDGSTAFNDWHQAGRGTALLDVVYPLLDLLQENGSFDEQLYGAFYESYTSIRPLNRVETRLLPDVVALRLLQQSILPDGSLHPGYWAKTCAWQQRRTEASMTFPALPSSANHAIAEGKS